MLTADALKMVLDLKASEVVEIDGKQYAKTSSGVALVKPPKMETVECFSLTQLVSFLHSHPDLRKECEASSVLVNPVSHEKVYAFIREPDDVGQYNRVAEADFEGVFDDFESGKQYGQEEFIIALQSVFMQTVEQVELLKLVGKVKGGKMIEGSDDGISQTVSTKAGVHLMSEATVRPMWTLKPFKSFPEIKPVDVPYILRLHQRAEEVPKFSLHECDGGMWRVETTKAVRKWLQDQVMDLGLKAVTVL